MPVIVNATAEENKEENDETGDDMTAEQSIAAVSVLSQLSKRELEVADLITDRLTLEELPQAMADIKSRKRQIVKAMYVQP